MEIKTIDRLDPRLVHSIFLDCQFQEHEDRSSHIRVEGVVLEEVMLHPLRVAKNKTVIEDLLLLLDNSFMADGGGGASFLNMCVDKHGVQWTGVHSVQEELFILGRAIGAAHFVVPRQYWDALPGGMPFVIIEVSR